MPLLARAIASVYLNEGPRAREAAPDVRLFSTKRDRSSEDRAIPSDDRARARARGVGELNVAFLERAPHVGHRAYQGSDTKNRARSVNFVVVEVKFPARHR